MDPRRGEPRRTPITSSCCRSGARIPTAGPSSHPGTFYTPFNDTGTAFVPAEPYSANIIYGIDNVQPVRPFNRADYYIDNASVPQHCAPNTGVLVKAVVAHDAAGTTPTLLPLLDCVADMQVVYGLDNNADGVGRIVDRTTSRPP